MTDDPDNLTLLHLRSMRGEIAKLSEYASSLSVELRATRERLASLGTLQDQHHDDIAAIKDRLDRIERRLGLLD